MWILTAKRASNSKGPKRRAKMAAGTTKRNVMAASTPWPRINVWYSARPRNLFAIPASGQRLRGVACAWELTVVLHCRKVRTHEVGQQKVVLAGDPGAVADMERV